MKRFVLTFLAASSLLVPVTLAATRPHYGGTLRVAMRAAPMSLDPADSSQRDSATFHNLSRLIFDTLVILDDLGRPQPALATSWESEPGNQRWQFHIRHGVMLHDGTALTSDVVAASLRAANPKWKIFPAADGVVIECDAGDRDLPAELALPANSIAKRDGKLVGSGPFSISYWEPAKKLTLSAQGDYWGGRAFIDSIEIEMGKSLHEQAIAFDLGKADLIEIAPEQARRAATEGRRVETSLPSELMALVFARDTQSPEEARLREAFALSIDRVSMNNALLQGGGEPTGALLPNWMTGYAFLFPTGADLQRARQIRAEVRQSPTWTVAYDANDPVARVVAERTALNARDVGLMLQVTNSTAGDLRLIRVPPSSLDARAALKHLASALGLAQPKFNGNSDELYFAENAMLQGRRVVPLLHVRVAAGMGASLMNESQDRSGSWRLPDAWMGNEKP